MKNNEGQREASSLSKVVTVPNVLSVFRIGLVPLFAWLYLGKQEYIWAAAVLFLSGLTDAVDGYIARKFQLISNIGKVLDPVADKLTQIVALVCLFTQFPNMWVLLVLLIFKDLFIGVSGMLVVQRTGQVVGAKWHGKLVTIFFYLIVFLHVIWNEIPSVFTTLSIMILIVMSILSAIFYGILNYQILKGKDVR